jgi:hypothetical protein
MKSTPFSAIALLLTTTIAAQSATAAPALTEESRLGTNGIGPILVGMTVKQAEKASGRKIKVSNYPDSTCAYGEVLGINGVSLLLLDGIIERADISNPRILTLRGAKMGDSETQIKNFYSGQIKITPHPYTGPEGHYLTFYPKDRADKDYRLIFETRQGKVTRYRGGRLPAVDYIEGCS